MSHCWNGVVLGREYLPDEVRRDAMVAEMLKGRSSDLFLATFRSTPTANADGLDRVGGQHAGMSRWDVPLGYLHFDTGPRRLR